MPYLLARRRGTRCGLIEGGGSLSAAAGAGNHVGDRIQDPLRLARCVCSRAMRMKMLAPGLAGLLLATQAHAQPAPAQPAPAQPAPAGTACEDLRARIEARIRAAGVVHFSVTAVDAAASAPGRVVGQCERGARKLVYRQFGAGSAPARRPHDDILTECRDGTVTRGGTCGR